VDLAAGWDGSSSGGKKTASQRELTDVAEAAFRRLPETAAGPSPISGDAAQIRTS
jgi:hypothetical protein